MEPRLGADLSNVRVHQGAESADAAEQMGARAFTVGNDVHFGAGEFAPGTKEGDKLLAHELTHVVQGQRGGAVQRKAAPSDAGAEEDHEHVSHPEEPAEKEADAVADHVGDELHGGEPKAAAHDASGSAKATPPGAQTGGEGGKKVSRKPKESAASASSDAGRKIFRKPNEKSAGDKKASGEADAPGKRDIDRRPGAEASNAEWVHYLDDLSRFLRDQTGAEKEQLLDIRANREKHPVVGAISEGAASLKTGSEQKVPDEGIWDLVYAQLNKAHALFTGDKPDIENAKREMAFAVKLFEAAHRRVYEYRTRTEGGAQDAATTLRGIEIGCDITLTILSAGMGAGGANLLKLGARGAFKMIAKQAGKSLVKTAAKAAAVGGADKLAQGAAEEGTGKAIGLDGEFDVAKVLREAGEAAVMNFLGVLVGGSLSKVFMRQLGEILGSRMAPEAVLALAEKYGGQGIVPPELFVSKGWQFLVGVAGDACTTTLLTALSTLVEQLRTGGKRPTGEQFVQMVITQMIQNGLLQVIFAAVTHERAAKSASASKATAGGSEGGGGKTVEDKSAPAKSAGEHDAGEHAKQGPVPGERPKVAATGPQKSGDIDQLYREAAVAQPALAAVTSQVAEAVGGKPLIPSSLKGRGRAMEKIAADYGGDASRITDLARSSIVVDKTEQVPRVVKEIQARCKIVQMKDRFEKPLGGYRDILFTLEMPNGHIAELQVQLAAIQAVKEGPGHKLYEQARTIRDRAKKENRPLTGAERKQVEKAESEMKGLYDKAYESGTGGGDGVR